ncbi:MAG: 2Fe-2S iron-sulfur cluster binding domain-containing protein [Deltaproteobacteria bacterium]|jgi:xanthine dehydrogenase iron-sulfur-binding subunit|nr:2Fe-2S iron-sulfur cluster binding domain-containing protein [Deltaproteobacteria bacterium]
MKKNISFTINGRRKNLDVDIRQSLLDVIREETGITSTKEGCGVGECGACSVLIDEVLVDACIYMAVWVDGKTIRTAEGESKEGKLSSVQQAYVDEGAVQCGFCTPGLIMASTSFVENQKDQPVTSDDIRKAHAGNICRCTGYKSIINAVEKCLNE